MPLTKKEYLEIQQFFLETLNHLIGDLKDDDAVSVFSIKAIAYSFCLGVESRYMEK